MLRGFKQNIVTPGPRDPGETEPDFSLLQRHRSAVAGWGQGLWVQQTWVTQPVA